MKQEALLRLLISKQGQPDLARQVATLRADLSLETVAALKRRVDEEKLRNAGAALRSADLAQLVAATIGTDEAQALADWASGNALYHLSRYQEALEHYRRAEPIYAAAERWLEVGGLQLNQVAVLRDMSDFQAAIALSQTARRVLGDLGAPARRHLAILEMNVGAAYRQIGDLEAALATYDRGRAILVDLGDTVEVARMDLNRANVLQELDRFAEAGRLMRQARAALAESRRDQEVARADAYLGMLAYRRGRYQEALRDLEAAHSGFAAIPNPAETAMVDLYRSFVYRDLNLLHETISLASGAERRFKRDAAGWLRALALLNQAVGYRRLGEYELAARLLGQARRLLRRQTAHPRLLALDLERAYVALEAGHGPAARRLARRVERQLEPDARPAQAARLYLLLARCALVAARPNLASSQAHAERARTIAAEADLPELGSVHHLLGRICEQAGDSAASRRHYRAAMAAVEQVRAGLPLDELQMGFMDDKLPVYEDALRTSREHARPAEVFLTLNLSYTAPLPRLAALARLSAASLPADDLRAELRSLRERWHWYQNKLEHPEERRAAAVPDAAPESEALLRRQLRELEAAIAELSRRLQVRAAQVPGEALRGPEDADAWLAALQGRLRDGESLLAYFIVQQTVGVALLTADELRIRYDLAPAVAIHRVLRSWRFRLQGAPALQQAEQAEAVAHLARLYQALVAPLAEQLAGCRQLYLVLPPDWHDLPFAALFDGTRYLVERLQVTYLSAPEALLQQRAGQQPGGAAGALVVGYSQHGQLPQTLAEASQVAALLGSRLSVVRLLEEEATFSALCAALPATRLLHLATHAVFRPDNPFFSWMGLADARLTLADIYDITLPQQPLVILSACETGHGRPRGGGLLGMGRGFLAAGASGLIVSLWKVADQPSARLMADLYRHLAPDQPLSPNAGAALRQAQLAALARGAAPFYWAGFVFVGG